MKCKPNNNVNEIQHHDCVANHMETAASIVNDDAKWKEFVEKLRKEGVLTSMALRQALAGATVRRVSLKSEEMSSMNDNDDDSSTTSSTTTSNNIPTNKEQESERTTKKYQKSLEKEEQEQASLKESEVSFPGLCSLASILSESVSSSKSSKSRRASLGRRLWTISDLDSSAPKSMNLVNMDQIPSIIDHRDDDDEEEKNGDLSKILANAMALGGLSDLFDEESEED